LPQRLRGYLLAGEALTTTDGSGGRARRAARRIAGLYALVAAAWIVLSDAALGLITDTSGEVTLAGSVKGLAFVAVTALLLNAIVGRVLRREQATRDRLQAIVDGSTSAIYVKRAEDLSMALVNREWARLLGVPPERAIGRNESELFGAELAAHFHSSDRQVVERGEPVAVEETVVVDGEPRHFISAKFPLHDNRGRVTAVCGISTDITPLKRAEAERERLEAELAQTQRLEGLGRLAGGVAHDFNNLLLVILSYTDLLGRELPGRNEVAQIRAAAERAAALTQQLLVFGRREQVRNRPLDLDRLVAGTEQLLRRTLGEDIVLRVRADGDLPPVLADQGRLEQVLLNLAINARDALPAGGVVEIATTALEVPGGASIAGGRYVLLTVQDDGTGMAPEVVERAVEPFFTTKPPAKASGLGLATVYGIVRDAGGHLEISSVPARGTKVMIYLPVADGDADGEADDADAAIDGAGERVLLVEDAEPVRTLVTRLLEDAGYQVIAAGGGAEALARPELAGGDVDLLLTDVVMPEMSGRELADRVRERLRDLPVLYMSGYAGDVLRRHGVMTTGSGYVEKPFEARTLLLAVRRALQQRA
jgi:PAS domain S-box-containing protein